MKYTVSSFFVRTGSTKNVIGLSSPDPSTPDLDAYNNKLAEVCNALDAQGYDPAFIVPLNIGGATNDKKGVWSITRGAAVVGRLRNS